jgi:hypothetical protein
MFKRLHHAYNEDSPIEGAPVGTLTASSEIEMLDFLNDMDSIEEWLFGGTPEIWESHLVILVKIPESSERELAALSPTGKY